MRAALFYRYSVQVLNALSKQSVASGCLDKYAAKSRLTTILDTQLKKLDSEIVKSIGNTLKRLGLGVSNKDIVEYFLLQSAATPLSIPDTSSTIPSSSDKTLAQYSPVSANCKNLSELYEMGVALQGSPSPSKLAFPDGSSVLVKSWKEVVVEIITWFGNKGQLPALPFRGRSRRSKRWFLNTVPQHENGVRMESSCPINLHNQTIYIETNWSSSDLVQRLEALCKESGESPSGFKIFLQ